MPDFIANMEPHWAWLSLGVLLAAAEIIAPGFFHPGLAHIHLRAVDGQNLCRISGL